MIWVRAFLSHNNQKCATSLPGNENDLPLVIMSKWLLWHNIFALFFYFSQSQRSKAHLKNIHSKFFSYLLALKELKGQIFYCMFFAILKIIVTRNLERTNITSTDLYSIVIDVLHICVDNQDYLSMFKASIIGIL